MYINNCFTVKKPCNRYGVNKSLWVNGKLNVNTKDFMIDEEDEK